MNLLNKSKNDILFIDFNQDNRLDCPFYFLLLPLQMTCWLGLGIFEL